VSKQNLSWAPVFWGQGKVSQISPNLEMSDQQVQWQRHVLIYSKLFLLKEISKHVKKFHKIVQLLLEGHRFYIILQMFLNALSTSFLSRAVIQTQRSILLLQVNLGTWKAVSKQNLWWYEYPGDEIKPIIQHLRAQSSVKYTAWCPNWS
jgi:hypothetical protein